MTIETFLRGMEEIGKHFKQSYSPLTLEDIWPECEREPDDAMRSAFKRCRLEFNARPTPAKVRDLVLEEGRRISTDQARAREEEAKREKEEFRRGAAKAFKDSKAVAQSAGLLISAVLSRKITRAQFLEEINTLDSCFPEAGFREETKDLRRFYADRKMPMNKPCGTKSLEDA